MHELHQNQRGGKDLSTYKKHNLSSKLLLVLLVFALVATPFQSLAYAQTTEIEEEQDTTGTNSLEEVEDEEKSSDADDEEGEPEEETGEEEDTVVEDEDEEQEIDYLDFSLSIDEVTTTSNSITITWSTTHDIAEEFELRLDSSTYDTVSGDTNSYTFTDLNLGEIYYIGVSTRIKYDYDDGYEYQYFSDTISAIPDWPADELVPVSIITAFNEYPEYNDRMRIRGLDESNKAYSENWDLGSEGDLYLPLGKFEVTIYNEEDPSIAAVEEIEIKEGIDYINNPIQLKFKLKEMREEAEPFKFSIKEVTENSFTLLWNQVSKITGFELRAWNSKNDEYHNVQSGLIENNMTEYTFGGLKPNLIYSIDLIANYIHDLENWHYFDVKTYGEDAEAPKVKFENETLHKSIASELGIYFRDVTEADIKDLTYLSVEYKDIESLEGLQYANNLFSLSAYGNEISNIDVLANLSQLGYLDLDGNKVSDISVLSGLKNLYSLDLRYNGISNIDPLAGLSDLNYLYLNGNKITDILALKNLSKLENLDLNSNEISDIDSLSNMTDLGFLDLGDNKLSNVSALENLTRLYELSLYSNEISNIDALANLTELEYLDLDNNKISDLSALSGLKNLNTLYLSQNGITNIDPIANLSEIEYLYLDNNNISDIPVLKDMYNLEQLSLYNNNITDISGLAGLKNLTYLDLDYNNITDISVLKELPSLQTVYLYGMDITDTETIQYLRNDGVEVYYDGDEGDWNDWDNGDGDEDEDIIIDREEVLQKFPEEQGFVVSEDGRSISLDLSKQTTSESFELTPEQTKMLIENKQTLNLTNDDVQASIPASSFDDYDEPVTININEVKSDPNSLSSTYDFTIKQGTRNISQFDEGITLTFNVNASRAKNPNNLKVFYFNEETGEWEKVGGEYSKGKVSVVTYHFSKYTVFEVEDEDSDNIVEVKPTKPEPEKPKPSPKQEDPSKDEELKEQNKQDSTEETAVEKEEQKAQGESNKLPKTATNVYNVLFVGMLLMIVGVTLYLIHRRKAQMN